MLDADDGDDDNLYHRLVQAVKVTYPSPDQENCPNIPIEGDPDYQVDSVISSKRKPKTTPEELSKKWCIGLDTANKTLRCTTQSGMRNIFVPSDRKVRMKAQWLKYPSINVKMYGDAMHSKVPGLGGETGATILTNGKGFDHVYPWKTKDDYAKSLMKFIHDVGIPKTLVTDGASEMQKGKRPRGC